MVLIFMGMALGWWASVDASPLGKGTLPSMLESYADDEEKSCSEGEVGEGEARAAAPKAKAAGKRTPQPPKKSVHHSNIVSEALANKRCANKVHLAAYVSGSRLNRAASVAMVQLAEPLHEEHSATLTAFSTPKGQLNWLQEVATGQRADQVYKIVGRLFGRDLEVKMGLAESEVKLDAPRADMVNLCQLVFTFGRRLLFDEVTMLQYYNRHLPAAFFALTLDGPKKDQAAGWIYKVWTELEAVEVFASPDVPTVDSRALAAWLSEFVWAQSTWCRELCVGLAETDGKSLPGDLREEVRLSGLCPLHTVIIEYAFNYLRGQVRHVKCKRLAMQTHWHRSHNSGLVEEYGGQLVQPTYVHADETTPLAEGLFTGSHQNEFSLGEEALAIWMSEKGWPSQPPLAIVRQGMMTEALQIGRASCRERV